jgi:hypothetical protein
MPKFAFVKDGVVKHTQFLTTANPAKEKWIAINRSGAVLKETTNYDVMPGDLFIDGQFYKKNEDGSTTLLIEGEWTDPTSIRFAGIIDGVIAGQWGTGIEAFDTQDKADEFIDNILNAQIIEVDKDLQFSVENGWLYDGVNFTNPNSI